MTPMDLYEWALEHGALDCDIVIRDACGEKTLCFFAEKVEEGDCAKIELHD